MKESKGLKCEQCGEEKADFYLGVCHDCWLKPLEKELERGALPAGAFARGND